MTEDQRRYVYFLDGLNIVKREKFDWENFYDGQIYKQGEIKMANDKPGMLTDIYDTTVPKWRTVTIDKVENGFIVKIGCKTFVETRWYDCEDTPGLSRKLSEYWNDPVAAEAKYCK